MAGVTPTDTGKVCITGYSLTREAVADYVAQRESPAHTISGREYYRSLVIEHTSPAKAAHIIKRAAKRQGLVFDSHRREWVRPETRDSEPSWRDRSFWDLCYDLKQIVDEMVWGFQFGYEMGSFIGFVITARLARARRHIAEPETRKR